MFVGYSVGESSILWTIDSDPINKKALRFLSRLRYSSN